MAKEKHSKKKLIYNKKFKENYKEKYNQINIEYTKSIKSIFKKSCFNCHGNTTKYPWYYKVPGIKQLIDHDINEAKKHLIFLNRFPFKSHGTPLSDLNAIEKAIKNNTMPPLRYRIMHNNSILTKEEIKKVKEWITKSKEILK